jgi:hypothetical protein
VSHALPPRPSSKPHTPHSLNHSRTSLQESVPLTHTRKPHPKVLYLLLTLQPLSHTPKPPHLRVFGGCLATTRRLKSRPTLSSFLSHPLLLLPLADCISAGHLSPLSSFYKTHGKEEQNKTDGTVHARRSANARTKPKLKRRHQETSRSASARTKPKLEKKRSGEGCKKAFPPRQILRKLHLPVVVRALPVRSRVDSFVGQCDLPRRRPANLSLLICTTVASAA